MVLLESRTTLLTRKLEHSVIVPFLKLEGTTVDFVDRIPKPGANSKNAASFLHVGTFSLRAINSSCGNNEIVDRW
jgi:hypothetical protein